MIDCRQVSKVYPSRNGLIHALEDVSFSASETEILCVLGPSGCGKTTLLKLLAGLLTPSSGRIALKAAPGATRPATAMVFQEHGLFPWMPVLENVAFGLEMMGVGRQDRRERANDFLERVGLLPFARNYPHELSVGMRQRVGIARAFVTGPSLLLMDEPFGALDAQTRRVLQEELLRLWADLRRLIIYVTHDIEEAILLADRVLLMTGRPGTILEDISIPLPRPRPPSAGLLPEVLEIKKHIWNLLEDEVRKKLNLGG